MIADGQETKSLLFAVFAAAAAAAGTVAWSLNQTAAQKRTELFSTWEINRMLLLEQMLALFLIMCVGYYSYRKEIITDEVNRKLSAIVVNIANPAMVLSSSMGNEKVQEQELLIMAILAVAVFAVLILLAAFLPRLFRLEKRSWGAYRAMTVFGNIGFMGFPIISSIYGEGALFYATIFVIVLNVLIYTYGISVMRTIPEGTETLPPSEGSKRTPWSEIRKIFNIGVAACILTLIIYLVDIPMPSFFRKTTSMLGGMTAPLSMLVIGASLAGMDLKSLLTDKKLIGFVLFRLLAVPAVGLLAIGQFIGDDLILGVCMVMLATPVASMTTMLARQYGGDHELTARGVALSTILSVVTMPLIQLVFL